MNILIVEDEMMVAYDLQETLGRYGFSQSQVAGSYTEALAILQSQPFHLALLDIQLAGYKTGIDVAQFIRAEIDIPFIFLTAFEDLATVTEALETKPNAYLQKPWNDVSLYAALQLAIQDYKKTKNASGDAEDLLLIRDALFIKERQQYVRVPLTDIGYIRSEGNYMELHTADRKYLIRVPQKVLLAQLPEFFVKTHKSYIVNCNHLSAIGPETLTVGAAQLPVSGNYRAGLLRKLPRFS